MKDSISLVKPEGSVLTRYSDLQMLSTDKRIGVLCFVLGDEEYGVDLNMVRQIVKPPPLTWVPRVEAFILGVVSIRGELVTLLDLRQFMGLEPAMDVMRGRVLIVETPDETFGLLVDKVTQVRRLKPEELEKEPSLRDDQRTDHVLFITRPTEDELVVIIDLKDILAKRLG